MRVPGHHHGGSFGKASISSGFSIKTNSSDRDSHIDTLMKTIAKDPSPSLHGVELNDASSFKVTINKTSELETNNDTLKKLATSTGEKPNNQIKLSNAAITPLPPGQIKCNILKGRISVAKSSIQLMIKYCFFLFAARAEEELHPKLTNHQLYVPLNDGPDSLSAATFVSVVSTQRLRTVLYFGSNMILPLPAQVSFSLTIYQQIILHSHATYHIEFINSILTSLFIEC